MTKIYIHIHYDKNLHIILMIASKWSYTFWGYSQVRMWGFNFFDSKRVVRISAAVVYKILSLRSILASRSYRGVSKKCIPIVIVIVLGWTTIVDVMLASSNWPRLLLNLKVSCHAWTFFWKNCGISLQIFLLFKASICYKLQLTAPDGTWVNFT